MEAAARARARGALESLRDGAQPLVLMVDHGWGGGVERHVSELAHALGDRAGVIRLQPAAPGHVALRLPGAALFFDAVREWNALVDTLRGVGIDRVHLHHVHGLPLPVLELPERLGAAHWVTLHDFFPACPAYHLKDASLRFCGGEPSCRRCLDGRASPWGLSIDGWRARFGDYLARAERVIAPSMDAAARLRRFFPHTAPEVWPHPRDRDAAAPTPLRVIVPGAISVEKGLDVLEACVEDARSRALPLHFHVAGFLGRALRQWPEAPLTVSGQYDEGRLPELLAIERGDAFFFPVQVPETFSYTLSAALELGAPIVATDLGAFPERLAAASHARIVKWDSTAREFNDALLQARHAQAAPASRLLEAAAYAQRYLEGLARRRPASPLADVDASWLRPAQGELQRATLAWLYDDGIVAGKAASRDELRRRLPEVDAELAVAAETRKALQAAREAETAAFEAKLADACAALQRAQADAEDARARLRSLEASRSWRLLAPLRALARRLRLTRS